MAAKWLKIAFTFAAAPHCILLGTPINAHGECAWCDVLPITVEARGQQWRPTGRQALVRLVSAQLLYNCVSAQRQTRWWAVVKRFERMPWVLQCKVWLGTICPKQSPAGCPAVDVQHERISWDIEGLMSKVSELKLDENEELIDKLKHGRVIRKVHHTGVQVQCE